MKDLYKNHYIWFSVPGGVEGFTLEQINNIIKEWNNETFKLYQYGTFCDYLSYKENKTYYGFSFWNNENPLMNKLIQIKGKFRE